MGVSYSLSLEEIDGVVDRLTGLASSVEQRQQSLFENVCSMSLPQESLMSLLMANVGVPSPWWTVRHACAVNVEHSECSVHCTRDV
jgi:hypothetical protein